jgi:hypothetical protein
MATAGPLAEYLMQRTVEDNVTGKTIASARHSAIGNAPTSAAVSLTRLREVSYPQSTRVHLPADAASAESGEESDDSVLNEEEQQLLDSLVSKRHSSDASHLPAAAGDSGKALLERPGYVDIYTPALVGALVPANTQKNVVSEYAVRNGGTGNGSSQQGHVAQTPKGRPPETTCLATIASHRSSVCISYMQTYICIYILIYICVYVCMYT